ncbi:nuclear transport factor 2 family protein [Pseudomonas sp. CT11-2]|uniref:nuclear transport factor 2 family protein n=1 Tax=Pseudomonas sp. CT11-2 TaxID=3243023 RepID=UPI0039AF7277
MSISPSSDQAVRDKNKALFVRMLGHLGRKEFDEFEACLAPDLLQEWPYRPVPNMPSTLVGNRALRTLIERGMAPFDPYAYEIESIHDLLEPNTLIAEYSSHSFYHPTSRPYSNTYLSIFRFADDKIVYWREYVNPLIIKEALLDDFTKPVSADPEEPK